MTVKACSKRRFLESCFTKFFKVCNLGNTLAMTIIFYFKIFQVWCRFQKWYKNSEKVFGFSENCIWNGSGKFSQSWTSYLQSAVNVLTNQPKISRTTREYIFKINFPQNDGNSWKKFSHGDFASFWDTFRCRLSKGVPKRLFLQGGLTKFFRVCNFGKTLAMSIIFDFKIFQIWCRFQKWKKKKIRKCFTFFR